jgi:hypothetical protein
MKSTPHHEKINDPLVRLLIAGQSGRRKEYPHFCDQSEQLKFAQTVHKGAFS